MKLLFTTSCLLIAITQAQAQEEFKGCWKQALGRGVGTPGSVCPAGQEESAGLCYTQCRDGYSGSATQCNMNCPDGFRDDGLYCGKADTYGRGAGSINECENCERWGALWYPKCREGFHSVATLCYSDCPAGMADIGVSCAKDSYGRGVGAPKVCAPGQEYDAGLCYDPCPSDSDGVGPVCWGQCPAGTNACGALCLEPNTTCASWLGKNAEEIFKLIGKAASTFSGQGGDSGSGFDINTIIDGMSNGGSGDDSGFNIQDLKDFAKNNSFPKCPL